MKNMKCSNVKPITIILYHVISSLIIHNAQSFHQHNIVNKIPVRNTAPPLIIDQHDMTTSLFAGGGGGFGFGSNTSTKKSNKKKKLKNATFQIKKQPIKKEEPKLDRFGLPPPTEKDVFPDLDESIMNTIIPVTVTSTQEIGEGYSHDEIKKALKGYLQLNESLLSSSSLSNSDGNSMKLQMLHKSPPGKYK